ncbi:hypothetical protein DPMN_130294 [Dreissena polymorpha]|uniref:Uncharacterized protein n=1 Tax=Dreissena polymorpha TaxID=45954 RepID=A0A9D4H4C3_DREPO|nr:hypothetical protein DPMN_130294 [Dreissena polymorpha]
MRERDNTMTTIRQCDDDSATIRWRHLDDRRCTTDDLATSSLHSSCFLDCLKASLSLIPVHYETVSSQLLFCLPLLFPPFTVPCNTVLSSPDDRETCPYHFSLHLFTAVSSSSWGHICLPVSLSYFLVCDAVLVGYAEESSKATHSHGLYPSLLVSVHDLEAYINMKLTRARIRLIFELRAMLVSFQMVLSFVSAAVV